MKVELYSKDKKDIWDQFVKNSKVDCFLFLRDFMEYHEDRFEDYSLMIRDSKKRVVALLPANKVEDTLYSHQGLTFGGFIVSKNIKLSSMIEIFESLKEFLKANNFRNLIYKATPYIHHKTPFSEDIYLLQKIVKRELAEVINLKEPIKYSNGRKHSIRKAKEFRFEVQKCRDFKSFWLILENVLKTQHDSKPVHTLEEMEFLASKFEKNIELFLVTKEKKLYAGAITFVHDKVVKLQYVANYQKGRELGALDFLVDFLLKEEYKNKEFFDFGTSVSEDGINMGLIDQKERFGASAVLYESYELELSC